MSELAPLQPRRRPARGNTYHPVGSMTATEQRGGYLPGDDARVIEAITVSEPLTEEQEHHAAVAQALTRPHYPLTWADPWWQHLGVGLALAVAFAFWLPGYLLMLIGHGIGDAVLTVLDPKTPEPRSERFANPKE